MKNTLKMGLPPFSQEQTFFEMEFQSQFSYNITLYNWVKISKIFGAILDLWRF